MLNKKADARPLVRNIVQSPYVTSHISRLLSYTLRKKNGGAVEQVTAAPVAAASGKEAASEAVIDAEAADEVIEQERHREREQEQLQLREQREAKVLRFPLCLSSASHGPLSAP